MGYILDCAELSAIASLARTESRWGPKHHRTDYPARGDEQWLRHVVLQRSADCLPVVSYAPVGETCE